MSASTSFTKNNTTYTTTKFTVGKTEYACTVAEGDFNYVSVRKITSNPFGGLGMQFENFDAAVSHYKNRTIKLELTKIELGL